MADYIPRADAAFDHWAATLVEYVQAHAGEIGLTPEQVASLVEPRTAWESALSAYKAAQTAAACALLTKNESRRDFIAAIRPLVKIIQAAPTVTNQMRTHMHISISSDHGHIDAPESMPWGTAEILPGSIHLVYIKDRTGNAVRGCRPAGAMGCEVWVQVGGDPKDYDSYRYVGMATRSPFKIRHRPEDIGRNAHYLLRWINTRGETGPWSAEFESTIAGARASEPQELAEAA